MNDQIKLQEQTISQVTSILKKHENVVAAALSGSFADGTNTPFSDIDLFVVFDNDERKNIESIFHEITSIKPTLSTLYQLYDKESLILFEDGVRLDLTMEKRSEFDKSPLKPLKILFDKESILEKMVNDAINKHEIPNKPKWNENEGSFVDWFFWMFRQAYGYACQSEAVPGKSFEKKILAQNSISSIRDKLLNTLYYTNKRRDYLSNIDKDLENKFAETLTSNNVENMKYAIRMLVELYEEIIGKYCEKENLVFPKEKTKKIRKIFDEFDSY